MPFGFCTQGDVAAILSEHGMVSFVDDDDDYTADAGELAIVDNMIERAAYMMMTFLDQRYSKEHLSGNVWCKWCNASWASLYTAARRGMPTMESLREDVDFFKERLQDIHCGYYRVPEAAEMFDSLPSVTNYDVERRRMVMPVRVSRLMSTTDSPDASRMRWNAYEFISSYT